MRKYEIHITIEPVFDDELKLLNRVAESYNYKVADLLFQKREEDTPERSSKDSFLTGHGGDYNVVCKTLRLLIRDLKTYGYKVWRYKIEEILLDSRVDDTLGLLS